MLILVRPGSFLSGSSPPPALCGQILRANVQNNRRGPQKRQPGHNLALQLRDCRESVLRFLHEPAVPFTHNRAEQDVRMMKVRQKISDGFRSEQGAPDLVMLRSVLSSARKQGRNRLEALRQGPEILFVALPP